MHELVSGIEVWEWILLTAAACMLLVQIRDMKIIAYFCGFGNVMFVVCVVLIWVQGFEDCCGPDINKWVTWSKLPFFFGTACFSLEGIGLVLPVEKRLEDPSKFMSVMDKSIGAVLIAYLLFGTMGYVFWGSNVQDVIIHNLTGGLQTAAEVSVVLYLLSSYIIQMFPVSAICDRKINEYCKSRFRAPRGSIQYNDEYDEDSSLLEEHEAKSIDKYGESVVVNADSVYFSQQTLEIIARITLVAVTAFFALIFGEQFGNVVSLVGALSNSALAFILPQVFYIRVCDPQGGKRLLSWVIIFVGVLASVVSLITTISDMVNGTD